MISDWHSETLDGDLHLWIAPTTWSGPRHAPPGAPSPWLSAAEREEWATFKIRKRADEFRSGRKLLRHALRAAGFPTESLAVVRDRYRAPRIAGAAPAPAFSISHCGGFERDGWCVVVVGPPGSRVGVDAEPLASPPAPSALGVMAAGDERLWLAGAGPAARLRAWVVKECVQKTLGLGMHLDPRRIDSRATAVRFGGLDIALRVLERRELLIALGTCRPASPAWRELCAKNASCSA